MYAIGRHMPPQFKVEDRDSTIFNKRPSHIMIHSPEAACQEPHPVHCMQRRIFCRSARARWSRAFLQQAPSFAGSSEACKGFSTASIVLEIGNASRKKHREEDKKRIVSSRRQLFKMLPNTFVATLQRRHPQSLTPARFERVLCD